MMRVKRAASSMTFLKIKIPAAILLRQEPALQLVRELCHRGRERFQFLVEERAKTLEFFRRGQLIGADLFVVGARKYLVAKRLGVIEHGHVGTPRSRRLIVIDIAIVEVLRLGLTRFHRFLGFGEVALGKLLLAFLILALC